MDNRLTRCLPAVSVLAVALALWTPRIEAVHNESAAVIIDWNQLAQQHISGAPFSQLRQYAMVHVAMADAVVAIEGRYEPFKFDIWAPHGASAKAAAAQAGHDVLRSLVLPLLSDSNPANDAAANAALSAFATKLAADLASVPPGPRATGAAVGKKAAAWLIGWRQRDGFANADPRPPSPAYTYHDATTLPGLWRPTPSGVAQFSKFGDVEPFGVLSAYQFLPVPFPQLETPEYADDVNDVQGIGERPDPLPAAAAGYSPTQRTALLWAGGMASGNLGTLGTPVSTPFANVTNANRIWYNVARDVAQADRLSLVKTARLFALMAASMHDGVQTSQSSKFVYRLWRPETAIDQAGVDNNPGTSAEPGWRPLLLTPPYPSHSSNMTCIGAGAAGALRNVTGGERPVTATWFASNGSVVHTQTFGSFLALAQDEGNSRIWGGIHFKFEIDASLDACGQVADFIAETRMQALNHKYY